MLMFMFREEYQYLICSQNYYMIKRIKHLDKNQRTQERDNLIDKIIKNMIWLSSLTEKDCLAIINNDIDGVQKSFKDLMKVSKQRWEQKKIEEEMDE